MADEQYSLQTLALTPGSDLVAVSSEGQLVSYVKVDQPFRTPADFANACTPAGHTMANTAPLEFLTNDKLLLDAFIPNYTPQGPREYFAMSLR